MEFGKTLKAARESLNLSLQQISEKTKIRTNILQEIEDCNIKVLPTPYLISFIKTYAQAVRLPKEDIDLMIDEVSSQTGYAQSTDYKVQIIDSKPFKPQTEKLIKIGNYKLTIKTSQLINYLIYSAVGLIVIAIIYITFFMESETPRKFSAELEKQPDTTVIKGLKDDLSKFFAEKDSIILEAFGKDTAWLRIEIDGVRAEHVTMYPETEKQWSASEYFILSIGNEGAVVFKRDGQTLPSFGRRGTIIRNVKITRDQIDIASAPWADTIATKKTKKKEKAQEEIRFLEPSNVNPEPPKITR